MHEEFKKKDLADSKKSAAPAKQKGKKSNLSYFLYVAKKGDRIDELLEQAVKG